MNSPIMAWIYFCVFYISLFQVQSFGVAERPSLQRSTRSAYQKTNGSYKIINRLYGKPFVNKRDHADGSVIFPGLTSRSGLAGSLQVPEECKSIGICENASSYKDDLVEKIINDYKTWNKTFNSDVLEGLQIAERIGPVEDNVELCSSTERLMVPQLAQDSDKQWHRIVNTKENPQQRFRVELCSGRRGAACSPIAIFENGYQARCVQKYVLRVMVAINSNDEVIEKPFMVPSCCSCVAKAV